MNSIKIFSILILFFLSACVTLDPRPIEPRVTIAPLFEKNVLKRVGLYIQDNTRRVRQGGIRMVEDEFIRAIIEKGYTLASRSDINLIKKELKLQQSNVTEVAIAKKAKILNVSGIIIVDINKVDTQFIRSSHPTPRYRGYYITNVNISARLISAELGRVVWISSHDGRYKMVNRTDGSEALPPVAQIVASGLPGK